MTKKVPFWDTDLGKTVKVAVYLALSSVVGYLITASTNDPQLFGPVTALVNVLLVFVKQKFLTPSE
jgi:hypothetical protein